MKVHKIALAASLLLASAGVLATGSGSIVMKGKTAVIKDAYAYRHPASYDASVTQTTIVLSDKMIDAKKVNASADRDKALHALLEETKAVYWEVILYPDGTLWTTNTIWPGVSEVHGGGGSHNLRMTRNDAKGVEGTYLDPDEIDKENMTPGDKENPDLADTGKFDLKFAVDL